MRLYALTPGTYCFDVLSVAAVVDGCGEGASSLVGRWLPLDYDDTLGRVSLGTKGSFGTGVVSDNKGILTRSGRDMQAALPACAWHEEVSTSFELTADNRFTAVVAETHSMFTAACAPPPASDPCTTYFSMTLQIHSPALLPDVVTGACP
jgi:hypothetical protein